MGKEIHRIHIGGVTHVAGEHDVVSFLLLSWFEVIVIHTVGDDEDLVAFRMRDQITVRLADDGFDVECVENQ